MLKSLFREQTTHQRYCDLREEAIKPMVLALGLGKVMRDAALISSLSNFSFKSFCFCVSAERSRSSRAVGGRHPI